MATTWLYFFNISVYESLVTFSAYYPIIDINIYISYSEFTREQNYDR
jgi:hypothetical protein